MVNQSAFPTMNERWNPSVTVAAVIEKDGRYLLIEEHTQEGLRLNNPAGHLDPGESLIEACARECLEETAHPFEPKHLVGIYQSRFHRAAQNDRQAEEITYLRFAFTGNITHPIQDQALDHGIVQVLWMTLDEVRSSKASHRSPLVLKCIEDHAIGQRFPMDLIHTDLSVWNI